MFENFLGGNLATLSIIGLGAGILLALLVIWSLVWKGFALWFAAKDNKKWWFIAILLINTAGILEIIYIFGFSQYGQSFRNKMTKSQNKKEETSEENKKNSDCECATCEGCDCDCHKPIDTN
jgi:hypothetical protein